MKKVLTLTVMIVGLLALTACGGTLPESATEAMPALEEAVSEGMDAIAEQGEAETHTVHWGYEGEGAPENWVELGYNECAGGTQSPIDLSNPTPADLQNIRFEYDENTAVKILNNGHTIQVDQIEGSQIIIGDETYLLKQFHFHAPSEHTLNGEHFPIEMHLVHKTADESNAAVVGVFIREGAENEAFAPVWAYLPAEETEVAQETGATVNLAALLPAAQQIYRYDGSLTTPPCTPNILWSVMQTPLEMSAEQIAEFTRIMEGNNRPVQALNERTLQVDETP